MWFNRQSAVVEPEQAVETDADKLARAEAECIFSAQAYDLAVASLRAHEREHGQNSFAFTDGVHGTVQTFINDMTRRRLEKEIRETMARRNAALAERADLMMRLGLIH